MANSSRNHHESDRPVHGSSSFNGHNHINGNSLPPPENSAAPQPLQHNTGLSMDWTAEEQSILEAGLAKYASLSNLVRYAKIAATLENKTVRDVALRCRWMTKKENSKRRKENHSLTRKSKDRKEKVSDSSARKSRLAGQPGFLPNAQGAEDGLSYDAIGGATGQLLRQNAQALEQISANFRSYQINENIILFCQARDNILKILNKLSDTADIMKQMPPLPVKLNEGLANSILPHTWFPMQTMNHDHATIM